MPGRTAPQIRHVCESEIPGTMLDLLRESEARKRAEAFALYAAYASANTCAPISAVMTLREVFAALRDTMHALAARVVAKERSQVVLLPVDSPHLLRAVSSFLPRARFFGCPQHVFFGRAHTR